MAAAIAAAYGSQLHMLLAGADTKPVDICRILRELKHGDVFLADEIHSLPADAQQIFFIALDQWKMPSLTERGIDRLTLESIAKFTLIAATNEPGRIKQALRTRSRASSSTPTARRN